MTTKASPSAKKGLGNIILEHELVPTHEIMTEEEIEALLARYGISKDQLPKISLKDPVVKTIDAEKGNILRILRKSATAGEAPYYRLVI